MTQGMYLRADVSGAPSATRGEPALLALVQMRSFREVARLAPDNLDDGVVRRVAALCEVGARLLDLDAEDFNDIEFLPGALATRIQRCWMPQDPRSRNRGALSDLRPVYELMLEVLRIRWERGELIHVGSVLHLMAEYLPVLGWQDLLGHAADPVRISDLAGGGSLWGCDAPRCPQAPREKSAARRSVRAGNFETVQWRRYLDREHSFVAAALQSCGSCRVGCSVTEALGTDEVEALRHRMTIADKFKRSPIVALRHAAPVGHAFGVPSFAEVLDAWDSTWQSIAGDREQPLDDYPLAGLPWLISMVAGVEVSPSDLIDEVASVIHRVASGSAGRR